MKMDSNETKDNDLLYNLLKRKYINEQLEKLNGNKTETDKSFVYLESDTLNLLLVLLLMKIELQSSNKISRKQRDISYKLIKELDSAFMNSKKGYEEILNHLKKEL